MTNKHCNAFHDALALLTATEHNDHHQLEPIVSEMCPNCVIGALITIVLGLLKANDLTVADFAQPLIADLERDA